MTSPRPACGWSGAVSPSTMVFLGNQIGNYNVNIVGFSAVLKF